MLNSHKNIILDSWLSRVLKRQVYKVVADDYFIKESAGAFKTLESGSVFLYAKIPTHALDKSRYLESVGFYLVDTNIVLEKAVEPKSAVADNCEVRFAAAGDEDTVVELARQAFFYSRFHLDSAFSKEAANTVKAEWARNYFLGKRGEFMVVASVNGSIAGFLQILKGDKATLLIDLIAVDDKHRRQGIAADMINYAENNCKDAVSVRVGTQAANIPSLRFYEKIGFRVTETNYIFHYHR